ncbi:GrpB family protein [Kribbella sp. NPDC006257]|uniref:GrpB family protein n=1 Tax=Kribbella sp. NPDC006257 TaxID=3156738 RepID=UPI0033A174E7
MAEPIRVVKYDPDWPRRFAELGTAFRTALAGVALRIDHIGSTAIPGLAAKPVIDVQISVADLEPVEPFKVPLEQLGLVYRADNSERTKRYFREPASTYAEQAPSPSSSPYSSATT